MLNSGFFSLRSHGSLPPGLQPLPELLWCSFESLARPSATCLISGRNVLSNEEVALVSLGNDGRLAANFAIDESIDGLLLESYRDELSTSIEMKLPFNYSLCPNLLKLIAKKVKGIGSSQDNRIQFPHLSSPFSVEWLMKLCALTNNVAQTRSLATGWPSGYRAAAVVTHDVDTDWLFNHLDWLDRYCDMEAECGFKGVWYCVPHYSRSRKADRAIQYLIDRGQEIGCHGYNHDAKLPLLSTEKRKQRYRAISQFVAHWNIKGFRSEWLWRSKPFLEELAEIFEYDSTVPARSVALSRTSLSGCASCFPYITHGDLLEVPLSLPMDDEWRNYGVSPCSFWRRQVELSNEIVTLGGAVVVSIHPQPHQSANEVSFKLIKDALSSISRLEGLWKTTSYEISRHFRGRGSHAGERTCP